MLKEQHGTQQVDQKDSLDTAAKTQGEGQVMTRVWTGKPAQRKNGDCMFLQ